MMTLMKYSGVRNFFLSNINLHIIAKHLCCIRKKKFWSTNVIPITSPFPQTNLVSSTLTIKMKGLFVFMIVLACIAVSYSEATITADIVSAAYDELKTFLNANGKYMGRMVRLSKHKFDRIIHKNLNTFYSFP